MSFTRRFSNHRLITSATLALIAFATLGVGPVAGQADDDGLIVRTLVSPTTRIGDLAWDGEALWLTDWEAGELLRISPETGEVLRRLPAPCYRPRGMTWANGVLYLVDDFEGQIYLFDPETEVTITTYPTPGGTGLGLAWDGEALWLSDNGENTLHRLIPRDGTSLTYFDSPEPNPGGLAFDGSYLWVTQRLHDRIFMVDPITGKTITSFDSPGPYPCGIAPTSDGRLWVADFEDGLLSLCAPRESPHQTLDWRESEIRMTYRIENHGPGTVLDAVVNFAIPEMEQENQVLLEAPAYEPEEPSIWQDRWGQSIATFQRDSLPPGERFEVGYRTRARLADLNIIIFPDAVGELSDIPSEIREKYTVDGERLQIHSDLVRETATGIVGEEEHPYWMMRKIYDWVIDNLEYERVGGWDVPATLIKRGTGSCSEYTFLFIALCRAVGLPARYEAGTALRKDDASVDDVHHRWAEVYLPGYGWIPVDPSRGDQPNPGGQADAIGRLSNRLFVTTHGGGGSEALSWTYNYHATHSMRGRCSVNEDEWVVWRRAKEEGQAIIPSGVEPKP
jgi:hypothetical protein